MAKVQVSRFALLNIEDEDDSDSGHQKKPQNGAKQQQNANKKKNKKKKKIEQQKENEELRSLAFAPSGGKSKTGGPGSGPGFAVLSASSPSTNDRGPPVKSEQWDEWKKADKEFTADVYEKDLQQALMQSKLEFEEHKQVKAAVKDEEGKPQKGKKKKKDKPSAMSLGEFQHGIDPEAKVHENGSGEGIHDRVKMTPEAEADPKFFDNVESDAHKIIRKEEIQEEYRKQYIVENARTQHFELEISKRDDEIKKLKKVNNKLGEELKEVKERNQQLCMILAQGEMKGKTAVLKELNDLKQVRDELTEEVTSLTTELEKERSKVHALKSGSEKTKQGGKHGK